MAKRKRRGWDDYSPPRATQGLGPYFNRRGGLLVWRGGGKMGDLIIKMQGSPNLVFEDHESSCGGVLGIPISYEGEACGVMDYSEIPRLIKWLKSHNMKKGGINESR